MAKVIRMVRFPRILVLVLVVAMVALFTGHGAKAVGPTLPVSHWKAEGDAIDSAGNNDGTLENGVTANAVGKFGTAFSFDGVNDFVNIPLDSSLLSSTFTVEAWGNPDAVLSGQRVIFAQNSATQLVFSRSSQNRVHFFINSGGFKGVSGTTSLPPGTFTHVAGTWDGTALRIYVNGVKEGESFFPGGVPSNSGFPFTIGGFSDQQFFDGRIDEVKIYDTARTSEEIAAQYNTERNATPVPGLAEWGLIAMAGLMAALLLWKRRRVMSRDWG